MSILIDKSTRLIVQGITGRDGLFHAKKMKEYGTHVVGGTSPGKGGTDVDGIPVFNTMYDAVEQTKANTSIIFVPARFAADAIMEAADAGIRLIVCIAEGIPTLDVIKAHQFIKQKGAILVGPNCPGLISPGKSMVGILPGQVFQKGNVGVISRSGTLTYEIVYHLTANGMGQSTAIGIGGDPVVGLHFRELLEMFQNDTETEAIVLIGEIGGNAEEQAAEYIRNHVTKPVVAFIAGQSAPLGKQMGHAGAIISGTSGSAKEKIEALEAAGIQVAQEPSDIPALLKAAKDTTRDILKLREQELVDLELELNNMVDDEENNNRD
jgi:succinyl-CoA synthetase alpha subunit